MSNLAEAPVATVVQGHTFTINKRYEPKKILGRGSFGVVTTAIDHTSGNTIAIKRIRPYANDEWDARHTLREVRLMKVLGAHPNIISLYELSLFDEKSELYMMMELMDCDLHRIIQSKQPLNDTHFKAFARQMLEGVKAMHSIGIFHRDLKPGNILVSKDCQLRITDFGLARFMDEVTLAGDNRQNPMTEYVVTRWYRCPELLLAPKEPYSCAIDLWSVGCIIGELIKRKPLFPGKSHANQVQLILEVKGYQGPQDLGVNLTTEASSFLDRRCKYNGQKLSSFIPQASPSAIELLTGLLQLDPARRPTAAEALSMAYIADAQVLNDYTNPANQPRQIDESFFDFERKEYSIEALREMIKEEVQSYKPRPVSSGTVRTGALGGKKSPTAVIPPRPVAVSDQKKPDVAIDRQMSATGDRELSGPSSQAPTAVRGRQMSAGNINPADDRIDFSRPGEGGEDFREVTGEFASSSSISSSKLNGGGYRVSAAVADSGGDMTSFSRGDMENQGHRRSGSTTGSDGGDAGNRKSSSRKAPATPSPGKMQSIAKQERKQKRIFFLQSMQRKKVEGGETDTSEVPAVSYVPTGGQRRVVSTNKSNISGGGIRAGGIGYAESSRYTGVPPLPVDMAVGSMPTDNGELSNLFNQFQSSSFSARERRETLPADNHVVKYDRQLNSAPDISKSRNNSRFPSLRGSGKMGGSSI